MRWAAACGRRPTPASTWRPVSDRQIKTSSPGAIQIAASNPDVVYVGMGETQLRGNIIQGDGVYKTIDGGKTWTSMGLEKTLAISRIRIHPTNPDVVFVAALGNPYGPNPERGVFRSKDGGKAWERVLFRDDKTGAVDLVIDPKNPDVLYATLWEVFRTPHSLSSGGPGGGLFKSTDGGTTWTELTNNPGLPKPIWGKIGIAVSGADSNRLFAIIEAKDGGIFMSDDAGATWKLINEDRRIRQRAFYYTRIYGDPKAKDTLLRAQYRAVPLGRRRQDAARHPGAARRQSRSVDRPERRQADGEGERRRRQRVPQRRRELDRPAVSDRRSSTTSSPPPTCPTTCAARSRTTPRPACRATAAGDELYDVGGGESGYIAPDPRDTDVFYAGSYGGLLTRTDRRTGEERAINVWPDNPMGHPSSSMTERFQWTFPIVISPTDPKTVYVDVAARLEIDQRRPELGEDQSRPLARTIPSTMGDSGGPITLDQTGVETYAVVFALAPSPLDGNVIWAGSDDGLVHVTRDGGEELDESHAAGPAGLRARQPDRGVAAPTPAPRTSPPTATSAPTDAPTSTRRPTTARPGPRSSTASVRDDFPRVIEEDPKREGTAVPRHRNRRLRIVRRRRRVAALQPRAAGDAGARDPRSRTTTW